MPLPTASDLKEAADFALKGKLKTAFGIIGKALLSGSPSSPFEGSGPEQAEPQGINELKRESAEIRTKVVSPVTAASAPEMAALRKPPEARVSSAPVPPTSVETPAPSRTPSAIGNPTMPSPMARDLPRPNAAIAATHREPKEHPTHDFSTRPAHIPVHKHGLFEAHTFANVAGSRTYKLYIPSHYSGKAVPLVIMLHGCSQSPDDFATGTHMNEVAEEQSFLVAYPAQPQSANITKCWNWFNHGNQLRDHGEASLIAGITRQIMETHVIDATRVYVAGLSAGGAAAAIMGRVYPDLYAAIGVHSGLACGAARDMVSALTAMRQGGHPAHDEGTDRAGGIIAVPTIVFHGDADTTVHPINGTYVIAQAKAHANLAKKVHEAKTASGLAYTHIVETDKIGQPMLEQWILHGAGHAWSGGSGGSFTEPRGPDASREMIRFFLHHRLARAEAA